MYDALQRCDFTAHRLALAFAALHGLDGKVLALVEKQRRDLDMSALHARRATFMP
jgi:uroporphyrinogen-III synthase